MAVLQPKRGMRHGAMTRAAARAAARGNERGTRPGPRAGSPVPTNTPKQQLPVQQKEQQPHQEQETLQQRQSIVRILRHDIGLSSKDVTLDVGEALAFAALIASLNFGGFRGVSHTLH